MNIIKILLFVILQILLLPLFMLGFVLIAVRQLLVSKKLGLSGTAIDVLQSRWIQHYFGGRDDPVTIELAKTLPNMSHWGMCLAMSGAAIAHRAFHYLPSFFSVQDPGKENLMTFMYSRHHFFDELFERNLDNIEQVVLMGAGFDTRSFIYCRRDHLKVFELDQTNTQEIKRAALKKAGLDTAFITFVPVDFNHEDWHEKLLASGVAIGKKTLFLWEGVTLYLDETEVRRTLQTISEIGGPGSVLALDLYSLSFAEMAKKRGGVYKNTTGETFGFGLDFSMNPNREVEALLNDAKLQVRQIKLCGDKVKGKEPFVALVEASVGAAN